MFRQFTAVSILTLLAACGDGQPFTFGAINPDTGEEEELDPTDPNTDINNRFLFDLDRSLTMNSVEYDAANDELIINNLPFDGPSQRYDRAGRLPNGGRFYESRQTATTGLIQHYAVFLRSDALEATAANGADWIEFGYGGANINRSSFNLPDSGEYVYVGVYSGVRTFSDRGGLELVAGEVEVLLDIDDLDPRGEGNERIQGSIVGTITDRGTIPMSGGGDAYDLPNVIMARVDFVTNTGEFNEGQASTFEDGEVRDSGTYEGLIAGRNGEEIGGYVVLEGNARPQDIRYEVIEYTQTIAGVTTTGTVSGLNDIDREDLQDLVDTRRTIDVLEANEDDVPEGATIVETRIETTDFETTYEARELGVFITDQVIP